jgi:hypothetical protein
MFFLSFCPGNAGDAARILAIHQTFKNVEKYYRLIKIMTLPCAADDNEITGIVAGIWRDKEHAAHKRIFSQDRRPVKVVRENPRLMVNCASEGERLMRHLRGLDIPVEGFFIQPPGPWSRETMGKTLGDNYRVGVPDLMCTVAAVYAQNRLDLTHCTPHTSSVWLDQIKAALMQNTLVSGDFADGVKPIDLLLGLSIPVWFRENIRYHRPYRA